MNLIKTDPELLQLDLIGDDERGYDFIDDATIAQLKQLNAENGVLSIYLDISPTQREQAMTRLQHGIDSIRDAKADEWNHEQRTTFDLMVKDLEATIEKMVSNPQGKGIALFASPQRVLTKKEKVDYAILRRFHLPYPPAELVRWGDQAVLSPLLVQRDESPKTGVVLFDREKARFFLHFMGEAAEYTINMRNPEPLPMTRSHVWHGYGEHNHHQWQEVHYQRYLHQAALAVEKVASVAGWKWLVLASPDHQEAQHLSERLSANCQAAVIGTTSLPLNANLNEVRDAVQPLVAEAERAEESATLTQWEEALQQPEGPAVAGVADTLEAVQEYRVDTLISEEGFVHTGWQCRSCHGLVADLGEAAPEACPYCGSNDWEELPDIIAEMAVKVISSGGHVEVVHDPENRKRAVKNGCVGGLLRY